MFIQNLTANAVWCLVYVYITEEPKQILCSSWNGFTIYPESCALMLIFFVRINALQGTSYFNMCVNQYIFLWVEDRLWEHSIVSLTTFVLLPYPLPYAAEKVQ